VENIKRLAILGAGPSALFIFKRLIEADYKFFEIDIFEKNKILGAGMPYSLDGANDEHITNVSGNEIPDLQTSVLDWLKQQPDDIFHRFNIDRNKISDYKVLPRLLFGAYLNDQFKMLKRLANEKEMTINFYFNSEVTDIIDNPALGKVLVELQNGQKFSYDNVIVCTGHIWPKKHEGNVPGYFDSPYPPQKLNLKLNHKVALRGSSLTAIDAIRTLSRINGEFRPTSNGKLNYNLNQGCENFKIIMHSRNGLLPAIRFHLEDSHLLNDSVLTQAEIFEHKSKNDGFLSLDFLFDKNFKSLFKEKDEEFYEKIKHLNLEEFVEMVLDLRESIEPFKLFSAEYLEAEKSMRQKKSIYWKELLAVLSYAMNKPAKYLSAEDMQRLQKTLMPLISIVIAFVPQGSVLEMLALNNAGVLDIVSVGEKSNVEVCEDGGIVYHYVDEDDEKKAEYFKTFIDCIGQPHIAYEDFPYKSLLRQRAISRARIKFKNNLNGLTEFNKGNINVEKDINGNFYLRVPGITINDCYQLVDDYGAFNERIYMMAVPYIGGFNPDYSGLDFCESASKIIIDRLTNG
jgi:hypothetical protein